MPDHPHFTTFSQSEDSIYEKFQHHRDVLFKPLCVRLTKSGIKPDQLTYASLLMVVPFLFLLNSSPFLAFLSLMLSLGFDSLDGCLARHQKVATERGAMLDIAVDHFVLFVVVLALIFIKTIDGFLGATYSLNYLLMVVLVMVMRKLKLQVFTIIKSKYVFYFLWALFIFSGLNFLDVFLVFFSIYMLLTNFYLFHRLRCSLPS